MKSWILGAITVACMTIGPSALACGTGEQGARPVQQPRPVQSPIQNVSLQASEMMERAGRLDTAAASREQTARMFDQQADNLVARVRSLRNQAQLVNAVDRANILDTADELSQRAANERMQAAAERNQAQQMRMEASNLRQRAVQLVRLGNGGGGWKGRAAVPPTSTPIPSERSVTL